MSDSSVVCVAQQELPTVDAVDPLPEPVEPGPVTPTTELAARHASRFVPESVRTHGVGWGH